MTAPNLYPAKYTGTSTDYLLCKADRGGPQRMEAVTASVTATSTTNTIVGLVPFRKGAMFDYSSTIYVADLDTGTTITWNIGYIYDDNVTYTNDQDAFASALTTGQAAGFVTFDEPTGMTWRSEGDGWIAMTLASGPSTTAGNVTAQITLVYDQS